MKKNPLISVVMAVYNTEKYVWEAIESILNQTYLNFEFLIIDDWSTDWSWEIIQHYAKKDKRIIIHSRENLWLVRTRNELLQRVSHQSEYIWILDSDDKIDFNWLQELVPILEQYPNISAVGLDIIIINKEGKEKSSISYPKSAEQKKKTSLIRTPMSHGWSIIRKQDFQKIGFSYDASFSRAHDYELWTRFIWMWFSLVWISNDKVWCYHRVYWWNQWKRKYLKVTLKNSIRIQMRLIFKYGIKAWLYEFLVILWECLLYLLPSSVVFWLYKRIKWI